MWRFFRLGIKGSNCPGNQTHFRIIGTTCANAECEDKNEECSELGTNKENYAEVQSKNLAWKAAQEHHNFLKYKNNPIHGKKPFNYEPRQLKAIDSSLKGIQWDQYAKKKKKIFSSEGKRGKPVADICKEKERNHLSEEESKLKNEEEEQRFGMLSEPNKKLKDIPEVKDFDEDGHPQKDNYEKKLSINDYGRKMLALCKERKLKKALEVLEVEMQVQKVIPNAYCYNILINACGKAGYTKKAFDLYYQMKRKGIKVEKFAFTGLFNACANSPFKLTEGLQSAQTLRKQIKENEIPLSPITYHAMIKAFGWCGDIKTAFEISDEMIEMKHNITTETLNFLLQACISDKESGFRHALMVWRKMRALNISPCIFSYNLLLRCVKECGGGDPHLTSQLLDSSQHKIPALKRRNKSKSEGQSPIQGETHNDVSETSTREHTLRSVSQISENNEVVKVDLSENMEMEIINSGLVLNHNKKEENVLPNILSKKFHPGNVVAIASLEKREERLGFLGGPSGLLESMMEDRVRPTVITFTFTLESLPSNIQMEEALLSSMENCKVVPDVIICNKLIHRRALRRQSDEAYEVLELMQKHHIYADLVTFGCLALATQKPYDINSLLKDMDKAGFQPNEEIMGSLIRNSLESHEYVFTLELLQRMKALQISPNEKILDMLEKARTTIRKHIIKRETNEVVDQVSSRERRKRQDMKLFLMEYNHWLKKSKMELKDHPWTQFGYEEKRNQVATISS